jgi:hypothetical protein
MNISGESHRLLTTQKPKNDMKQFTEKQEYKMSCPDIFVVLFPF